MSLAQALHTKTYSSLEKTTGPPSVPPVPLIQTRFLHTDQTPCDSDDGADYARAISRSITDQTLLLRRSLCVKVRAFGESNDLCVTSVTF